jgi:hypothetical protein
MQIQYRAVPFCREMRPTVGINRDSMGKTINHVVAIKLIGLKYSKKKKNPSEVITLGLPVAK